MNQFKKAKQIAQESGKRTESITDLKTAGVAANVSPNDNVETPSVVAVPETVVFNVPKIQEKNSSETAPETDIIIETIHNAPAFDSDEHFITPPSVKATTLLSPQEEQPAVQLQPLSTDNVYTPKAAPTKSTGTKKTVPNIFAPKGEAKSVRKSLVLKPTSVRIAENYCEKNGGSFNELVQTLLDNFIEEYGL